MTNKYQRCTKAEQYLITVNIVDMKVCSTLTKKKKDLMQKR